MNANKSGSSYPGLGEDTAFLHARTHILSFFQGLFRARPLGSYHWDSNAQVSEITITTEVPLRLEVMSQRPALILARGPVSFVHLGLNDFDGYDHRTGATTKTALVSGSFNLVACSRALLESESLAYFCASELLSRQEELQQRGGFFDVGRSSGIGAPSQAGSIIADDRGDGVIATSVTIPFTLPWKSVITPMNRPVLKALDVSMTVAAPTPPQTAAAPTTPGYPAYKAAPAANPNTTWQESYVWHFGRRLPYPKASVAGLMQPKPLTVRFGV